jgi:hypothetical protein
MTTNETKQETIRVWQIGPDGTEYFAANSEDEMKQYYRQMLGAREKAQADHDLIHHFEEVGDLDEEFEFDDDGEKRMTTWRRLAQSASELPCQISTGYN